MFLPGTDKLLHLLVGDVSFSICDTKLLSAGSFVHMHNRWLETVAYFTLDRDSPTFVCWHTEQGTGKQAIVAPRCKVVEL